MQQDAVSQVKKNDQGRLAFSVYFIDLSQPVYQCPADLSCPLKGVVVKFTCHGH